MLMQKGHRRIALLLPDSAHGGDVDSAKGFHEAFATSEALGFVVQHHETAEQVIESLDEALKRKPAPSAFLGARSIHTLTVVTHLLRLGHKLPRDFAIVSRAVSYTRLDVYKRQVRGEALAAQGHIALDDHRFIAGLARKFEIPCPEDHGAATGR